MQTDEATLATAHQRSEEPVAPPADPATAPPREIHVYDGTLPLIGQLPQIGDLMPDFALTTGRGDTYSVIRPEHLLDYQRPMLFMVGSSVETPVTCLQTLLFARRLSLFKGVQPLGVLVTSDLPFTLNSFAAARQLDDLVRGSDYLDRSFGINWGVLLDECMLLTRAAFVVDVDGTICHVDVPDVYTNELDYESILSTLTTLCQNL